MIGAVAWSGGLRLLSGADQRRGVAFRGFVVRMVGKRAEMKGPSMRTTYRFLPFSFLAVTSLILAGSSGCKKAPPPPPTTGSSGATQGSSGQPGGAVRQQGLHGEILETMDSGGYTYLKLKTTQGEVWAAVRKSAVSKGQRVTVVGAQPMKDFQSRTLKRTFPLIYFGQLGRGGQAARSMSPHGGNPHAAGRKGDGRKKRGSAREAFDKPLPKATGANARTVAEVHAQRTALAGKTVLLRGKVVRFSRNIMGKNWMHLQDGTGKTDDFDLTVTTQATAKAGDVVLVEGTVKTDVNLGAGYFYKVLVEQATVKPGQ